MRHLNNGCFFIYVILVVVVSLITLGKLCVNRNVSMPHKEASTTHEQRVHEERIKRLEKEDALRRRRGICPYCHGYGKIYTYVEYIGAHEIPMYYTQDEILVDLDEINVEIVACPHCNGTGKYAK